MSHPFLLNDFCPYILFETFCYTIILVANVLIDKYILYYYVYKTKTDSLNAEYLIQVIKKK